MGREWKARARNGREWMKREGKYEAKVDGTEMAR